MLEEVGPGLQVGLLPRLSLLLEELSGKSKLKYVRQFLAAEADLKVPDSWVHHAFFGKTSKKKMIQSLYSHFPARLTPIELAITLNLLFAEVDEALMFWRGEQGLIRSELGSMPAGICQG
jgi:hypothetical protein